MDGIERPWRAVSQASRTAICGIRMGVNRPIERVERGLLPPPLL